MTHSEQPQIVTPRKTVAAKVDHLVTELEKLPQVEMPVVHRFTPGLYIREIFMPKGTLVVSKVHLTEHPYVISQGRASVWTEKGGVVHLNAPHTGITQPGTRRILCIHEDCVWTTFHPTTETDVAKIEESIIGKSRHALEIPAEVLQQLKAPKEDC